MHEGSKIQTRRIKIRISENSTPQLKMLMRRLQTTTKNISSLWNEWTHRGAVKEVLKKVAENQKGDEKQKETKAVCVQQQ